MIGIIDYGVGNLFSLASSFSAIGEEATVSSCPEKLQKASHLLLPGVGAFGDAAEKLRASGLGEFLKEQALQGTPILGICLGMQLLFEKSCEYGEHEGLGLLKGSILPIADVIGKDLKIPHIGWNALHLTQPHCPLFRNTKEGDHVYFVHSFYATGCEDSLAATTEYGGILTAAVAKNNIMGCQFHPEKSGKVGLDILKAFCTWEVTPC